MRDKDAVDRIVIERALEALKASDDQRGAD
jgi:hypothetical protein